MKKVRYTRKQSIALGLIGGIFFIATGIVLATGGRDTIWGIVLLVLGVIEPECKPPSVMGEQAKP